MLKAGDRKLISQSGTIDESLLDHVQHGGGCIGSGSGSRSQKSLEGVTSIRLDIDMLLFANGELTGQDTEKYAAQILCRKRAAEFIAKQIRAAETQGRDVTPVLTALIEMPRSSADLMARYVSRYASDYLARSSGMRDVKLRHLENLPPLPKFFRRDATAT